MCETDTACIFLDAWHLCNIHICACGAVESLDSGLCKPLLPITQHAKDLYIIKLGLDHGDLYGS